MGGESLMGLAEPMQRLVTQYKLDGKVVKEKIDFLFNRWISSGSKFPPGSEDGQLMQSMWNYLGEPKCLFILADAPELFQEKPIPFNPYRLYLFACACGSRKVGDYIWKNLIDVKKLTKERLDSKYLLLAASPNTEWLRDELKLIEPNIPNSIVRYPSTENVNFILDLAKDIEKKDPSVTNHM